MIDNQSEHTSPDATAEPRGLLDSLVEVSARLGPVVTGLASLAVIGAIALLAAIFVHFFGAALWYGLAFGVAALLVWVVRRYGQTRRVRDVETANLFRESVVARLSEIEALAAELEVVNTRLEQALIQRFHRISEKGSAIFASSRKLQGLLHERVERIRTFVREEDDPSRLFTANDLLQTPVAFCADGSPSDAKGKIPILPPEQWEPTVRVLVRELEFELTQVGKVA